MLFLLWLIGCDVPYTPATECRPSALYADLDGDGYGAGELAAACPGAGWVANAADCDDADPGSFPGAAEVRWDGVDQDCDGVDRDCADAGPVFDGSLSTTGAEFERFCASFARIDGDLRVTDDTADLSPLSCLCEVTGVVEIADNHTLASLDGLGALARAGSIQVNHATALTSLEGLASLRSADSLYVGESPSLTGLGGMRLHGPMSYVRVLSSPLVDLSGLNEVDQIGALELRDLPALTSIDGLGAVVVLDEAELIDLPVLADLDGFASLVAAGSLEFHRLDSLSDVSGLGALVSADSLIIGTAPVLTTLAPMSSLRRLGEASLYWNDALVDISPLAALHPEDATVALVDNALLSDLTPLAGLHAPTTVTISGNAVTSLAPLADLSSVGELTLCERVTTLAGLHQLYAAERLEILGTEITDLADLAALARVDELVLEGNPHLTDLSALSGVTAWSLTVSDNDSLTSLAGLDGVRGGGEQYLGITGNASLVSLTGLGTVTSLANLTISDNALLGNVAALDSLTAVSGSLFVTDNPALPAETVDDWCERLEPLGYCEVWENGP